MTSWNERVTGQTAKGRRRGDVFSVRLTAAERTRLESLQALGGGPRKLGPWLVWRALGQVGMGTLPGCFAPGPGNTPTSSRPGIAAGEVLPRPRIVLDLCGGSGSWSRPYADAGYQVELVTLPEHDVRTYVPPSNVWGVLAAPPCTEFSLAKNGQPRDLVRGMETVNACMRIIMQARPRWWALENPTGLLGDYLGTPRDVFEPCDFGDAWTKRTALWGDFTLPERGPWVLPEGSAMERPTSALRAVTPPGFARAFFRANP